MSEDDMCALLTAIWARGCSEIDEADELRVIMLMTAMRETDWSPYRRFRVMLADWFMTHEGILQ